MLWSVFGKILIHSSAEAVDRLHHIVVTVAVPPTEVGGMLATIATEVTLLLDWIGPEAKATAAARVPLSLPLASTTPETRATGMSRGEDARCLLVVLTFTE